MSHPNELMVAPSLAGAAAVVFSDDERATLKEKLRAEQVAQAKYLRAHPEIHASIQEGMRRVLEAQPDDPVAALMDYFMSDDFTRFSTSQTEKA